MTIKLEEIKAPSSPGPVYNDQLKNGPNITPQNRIKLFSPAEWEQFTEECVHNLKQKYVSVMRVAGAGDRGIDIAAFKTDKNFEGGWDNYQCKHYDHPVQPAEFYLELGKLCYYTYLKEYSVPDNYFIIAPQGVGTSLAKLVRGNHKELKRLLMDAWPEKCENEITKKATVPLTGALAYLCGEF